MINAIREVVKAYPTNPKVLLGVDSTSGKFIFRELMKHEKGIINLSTESVQSFATRVVGFDYIAENIKPLVNRQELLVLYELVEPDGYFGKTLEMPGFLIALWNCICDLRISQTKSGALSEDTIGNAVKADELANILKKYRMYLTNEKLSDYTRILSKCIANKSLKVNSDTIVLLPGNLPVSNLEMKFLEQAGDRLIHLPYKVPSNFEIPSSWREKTKVVLKKQNSLLPSIETTDLFCGTCPQAEIREIIRRIVDANLQFENIAIVLANKREYLKLLTAHLELAEIPYAIGMSRSITEFRAGRLAINLCKWANDNFPADGLIAMLAQGDLKLFKSLTAKEKEDGKHEFHSSKIINLIKEANVVGGKDGYEYPLLAVGDEANKRGKPHVLKQCRRLVKLLKKIFTYFPEMTTPAELSSSLSRLLTNHTRINGPEDGKKLGILTKRLLVYGNLTNHKIPLSKGLWWLNLVIQEISVPNKFEPDGKVIVTTLNSASTNNFNRMQFFYPGLSHNAIPGKQAPRPVISDYYRHKLPQMPVAELLRQEKTGSLFSAWAILPEKANVVLSMSLSDQRGSAMSPSSPFTKVLSNKLAKNIEFSKILGTDDLPLIGQMSNKHADAIDLKEWFWQKQSNNIDNESLSLLFADIFKFWTKYEVSQRNRQLGNTEISTGLSNWEPDKWNYVNNRKKAISTSGINEMNGCKFAVFLSKVIGCMPYEKLIKDKKQDECWLDAMQRGTILHEIYEHFLKEAGWPIVEEHKELMIRVANEVIDKFRNLIPPQDQSVFLVESAAIRREALYFFELEKNNSKGQSKPISFEMSFGLTLPEGETSELGLETPEPVEFKMKNSNSVYLKGKIDRIDESPEGLTVLDYKTGSPKNYREEDGIAEHAKIQLALYKYAVTKLLKANKVDKKIISSKLYFPTNNSKGEQISFKDNNEEMILETALDGLFDFIKHGCFEPNLDCDNCNADGICPYSQLPGEDDSETKETQKQNKAQVSEGGK